MKNNNEIINTYDIKRQIENCRLMREQREREEYHKQGIRISAEQFFATKIFNRSITPLPKDENEIIISL